MSLSSKFVSDQLLRDLHLLCEYPSNFSGQDCEKPTEQHKKSALVGLTALSEHWPKEPSLSVLNDGTLMAYWKAGEAYLSIDFEKDGDICFVFTPDVTKPSLKLISGIMGPADCTPPALLNAFSVITEIIKEA